MGKSATLLQAKQKKAEEPFFVTALSAFFAYLSLINRLQPELQSSQKFVRQNEYFDNGPIPSNQGAHFPCLWKLTYSLYSGDLTEN